jgi:hypothetical protein
LAGRKTARRRCDPKRACGRAANGIADVSVAMLSSEYVVEHAWEYLDIKLICTRGEDAIHD